MNSESSPPIDVSPDPAPATQPAAELARWVAAVFLVLLLVVAVLLWWRWVAGALLKPPGPAALLSAGALLAAAAASARIALEYGHRTAGLGRPGRFAAAVLSAAVVATGAVLSLLGTSRGVLVLFCGVLVAEECWAWGPVLWRRLLRNRGGQRSSHTNDKIDAPPRPATHPIPSISVSDRLLSDEVTQQIVRGRTSDGGEVLSGWLRVPMVAGQRSTSVHLAFCPPFARTPRVAIEQLAGPQARIKTGQLLPFGVRFDLKLAALSEAGETVLLQFSAETGPPGRERHSKARGRQPSPEA